MGYWLESLTEQENTATLTVVSFKFTRSPRSSSSKLLPSHLASMCLMLFFPRILNWSSWWLLTHLIILQRMSGWQHTNLGYILVTCPHIVACTFKLGLSELPPNIQATTEGTKQVLAPSVSDPVTRSCDQTSAGLCAAGHNHLSLTVQPLFNPLLWSLI